MNRADFAEQFADTMRAELDRREDALRAEFCRELEALRSEFRDADRERTQAVADRIVAASADSMREVVAPVAEALRSLADAEERRLFAPLSGHA